MPNQYKKQCPKCNTDMVYSGIHAKYHLKDSIRLGRKCNACSQLGKVLSIHTRQLISQNNGLKGKPSIARKRPYEWLYNRVVKQAKDRNQTVELSFDQFLDCIKQTQCHYCHAPLAWSEYHSAKTKNFCFNLDRMNNESGYTKDNLCTCCWRCNHAKSNIFSYDEWYGMTEYFRKKKL